jgi:hypothetical protein
MNIQPLGFSLRPNHQAKATTGLRVFAAFCKSACTNDSKETPAFAAWILKDSSAVSVKSRIMRFDISNRALLLAALTEGETELSTLLVGDDVEHMLSALKRLGVDYALSEGGRSCQVVGLGGPFSADGLIALFLGNAGTAMGALAAALALSPVEVLLTGEPWMEERPRGHLFDSLRQLGAEFDCEKEEGYPPPRSVVER